MSQPRMARLGLLGGTSWESTLEYYRRINEATNRILGGLSTAEMIIWSFDFGAVWALKERGDSAGIARMFDDAARHLAAGGAELLVICSNAGHLRADAVAAASRLPVVHIVDAAGAALQRIGARRAGLLGTLDTMQGEYYRARLRERFAVETLVPDEAAQQRVHAIAIEEVARGRRLPGSTDELARIVEDLARQGADAVILGCTELPLVAPRSATPVPLLDTIALHVEAIVERASAAPEPMR